MIAVFEDNHEIIVVGLNADGSPMDSDGTLFGPESGRDINMFERLDVNVDEGEIIRIESSSRVRVR
jgi:hypothetical protein